MDIVIGLGRRLSIKVTEVVDPKYGPIESPRTDLSLLSRDMFIEEDLAREG